MTNDLIMSNGNELTPEDIMINVLTTQKEMKEQLKEHSNRIEYLQNEQPVNPSITKVLEKKRKHRVMFWLGGKASPAYRDKNVAQSVFAEAGKDFKGMFKIPRYDLLQKKDEEMAMLYWDQWEPSTNTKMEIRAKNNQLELIQ